MNSLSAIEYNDKYLLFNFEQIVIITDKKVKIQLFCFLTDLISDQIINITINKQVLIKTSSDDYIFNSDGSLLFKGNFGEYLSDGPIKVLNEKGEYLWFDNKLIGPISGFIFDKINICYSNKNRIVIIEDDNLLDINLDESDFKIYKSNIKDLKLAKIGWKTVKLSKFDESIFILTDGVMYYYFNFIDNQFNEYPFGIQIFDFSNGKLSWMSFDGGKIDFSLDYEKILDFSYLDDDLLIVAQKSDEYYLISTKNGIIKKGKKPFAFHRNWGGYVMIDPQPGKKIDLFYYDDLHNKLYHFPFKLSGVDLKKRDSQFQISLDSLIPFISVEFQKFNNPIAY